MSPEIQAVPSPRPGVIVSTKKEVVINDVQMKTVSIFLVSSQDSLYFVNNPPKQMIMYLSNSVNGNC